MSHPSMGDDFEEPEDDDFGDDDEDYDEFDDDLFDDDGEPLGPVPKPAELLALDSMLNTCAA